ncbi:unnamed protein product, partial [Arabidopsis halleri]
KKENLVVEKKNECMDTWTKNVKEKTMTDLVFIIVNMKRTHALMFLHVKKGLRVGISLPHESLSTSCLFLILLSSF